MDIGISVLVVFAMLAGGALGTFRHRIYGIWSFFGILLAMTIANVAGSLFGTYLTTAVNGDIVTITVLVKITLVVVISLLVSYYCDNLIPITPDPKTQIDNIYAALFGLVNAYLVVASILGYLRAIPSADPKIAENMFANSFNNWLFNSLPWVMLATFVCVIGWASLRKIREAVVMLKASMQKGPARSTSSTTANLPTVGYPSSSPSYQSPANISPPYPNNSGNPALTVATATATEEPKQNFFGRLFGGIGRKPAEPTAPPPPANPSATGYGNYGQGNSMGLGASNSSFQSPMGNASGTTPPYGINTGSITGANPSYGTPASVSYQSPTQTGFGGMGSLYTPPPPPPAPSYPTSSGFGQPSTPSSGFGQPNPPSMNSGYQPSFGSPAPSSGYVPPALFGANTNYGNQDEPDYADQSTYDEDNDQNDDNDGYSGYNGANQPPPYRG